MTGLKIAVQTRRLGMPLKQALHTLRRLGADGAQFDLRNELAPAELSATGQRQLRKLLDDLNLRVGSATFPTRRGFGDPGELERRIDAARRAMALASGLGARVMLVAPELPEESDSPARELLRESLLVLSQHASRYGVILGLQCPGHSPAEITQLLEQLPEGLVGVDVSPADLISRRQKPLEFVSQLGARVVHVFASDAVRSTGGETLDVELGRGSADIPELLGALEEFNYRDWITIERRNSTRTAEDVENAIAFLRAI